jgi:hypothetical protein
LLLNIAYGTPQHIVDLFRRSALLDIDPGLLQTWVSSRVVRIARHTSYFTIGETVGRPEAHFPDLGLQWHHVPPCVALDSWRPTVAAVDAPFTTVSNWYMDEYVVEDDGNTFRNDKRSGLLPFLDLPALTSVPLELALCIAPDTEDERVALEQRGWRVRHASEVSSTPRQYQTYIQRSRGEFGCAKPGYVRLETAWLSDRTVCYLASGKPAVVQHTGASKFMPDCEGLFRFRTPAEAAQFLEQAVADYDRHSASARAFAEEHLDARKAARRVLEVALA